ncbi:MAG: hypothetical protein Q8L42_10635, partial [Sulfurimicrobium sp.]|nr:hypothetical protein [Sulfurimicrobium sp.]
MAFHARFSGVEAVKHADSNWPACSPSRAASPAASSSVWYAPGNAKKQSSDKATAPDSFPAARGRVA